MTSKATVTNRVSLNQMKGVSMTTAEIHISSQIDHCHQLVNLPVH